MLIENYLEFRCQQTRRQAYLATHFLQDFDGSFHEEHSKIALNLMYSE